MPKRKETKVTHLLEFTASCELALAVFEKLRFLPGSLLLWLLESSFPTFMLTVPTLTSEKLIVDCYTASFSFRIWANECLMNSNPAFGWLEAILYSSKTLCSLKVWRLSKVGSSSMMIILSSHNEHDRKNECNEHTKLSTTKFLTITSNRCQKLGGI